MSSDVLAFVAFAAFAFAVKLAGSVSRRPDSDLVVGTVALWFNLWDESGGWDNDRGWSGDWWELRRVVDWTVLALNIVAGAKAFLDTVCLVGEKG